MSKLSKNVLKKIKQEHSQPIPRWHFIAKNIGCWSITAILGCLGIIATMLIFYFATNLDILDLVLESPHLFPKLFLLGMPFTWLVLALSLAFFAGYSAGKTNKGYKHTFVQYLGIFLVAQVLVGGLLSQTSMAEEVETKLSRNIQFFETISHKKERLWGQPEMGLLRGRIQEIKDENWIILAHKQEEWTLQISEETEIPEGQSFEVGHHIRAQGEVGNLADRVFEASKIIPMEGRIREFREKMRNDFEHLPEAKRKSVRNRLKKNREARLHEVFKYMTPQQQIEAKERVIKEGPRALRDIIQNLPEETRKSLKKKNQANKERILKEAIDQ